MPDGQEITVGKQEYRDSPDGDIGFGEEAGGVITNKREAGIQQIVGTNISIPFTASGWSDQRFFRQHSVQGRQGNMELTGIMAMNKDMTEGFTQKFGLPGGLDNIIPFLRSNTIPGGSGSLWFRVNPASELAGIYTESQTSGFLGESVSHRFINGADYRHSDILGEMADKRPFQTEFTLFFSKEYSCPTAESASFVSSSSRDSLCNCSKGTSDRFLPLTELPDRASMAASLTFLRMATRSQALRPWRSRIDFTGVPGMLHSRKMANNCSGVSFTLSFLGVKVSNGILL